MPEGSVRNPAELEVRLRHQIGALTLDVAFTADAPQTVLFGPSGAGKTTILRCIAGFEQPERGFVSFRGMTLLDTVRGQCVAPRARGVGFVAQRSSLFPHMTASENVGFGLHGLSPAERRARIAEALDVCLARSLAGRRSPALSGGEKQRVAIARAIAPVPKLLLLDEPFVGMDFGLRTELLPRLNEWINRHSIATLYVTHELPEVFELQAEVVVIDRGAIVRQGPANEVLQRERQHLFDRLGAPVAILK